MNMDWKDALAGLLPDDYTPLMKAPRLMKLLQSPATTACT